MRILFTGASSFTGFWFVSELARRGHDITATFRRAPDAYEGVRAERVEIVSGVSSAVFECAFGDDRFLELIDASDAWDVLCHHAADVTDYRSPAFDVISAVDNNTRQLAKVLEGLGAKGCRRLVLTGSVFEQDEGAGSEGLRAFSPYGLSKGLTAQVFRYWAAELGMRLSKFVIPNPFGPYEEPRFTAYLMRSWFDGKIPSVSTPAYVRDNIHVSLLARAYRSFVEGPALAPGVDRLSPSGYIGTQGEFARRFAAEMAPRLGIACPLELQEQTEFHEPHVRINTDPLDPRALEWDERQAWDDIATYYRSVLGSTSHG